MGLSFNDAGRLARAPGGAYLSENDYAWAPGDRRYWFGRTYDLTSSKSADIFTEGAARNAGSTQTTVARYLRGCTFYNNEFYLLRFDGQVRVYAAGLPREAPERTFQLPSMGWPLDATSELWGLDISEGKIYSYEGTTDKVYRWDLERLNLAPLSFDSPLNETPLYLALKRSSPDGITLESTSSGLRRLEFSAPPNLPLTIDAPATLETDGQSQDVTATVEGVTPAPDGTPARTWAWTNETPDAIEISSAAPVNTSENGTEKSVVKVTAKNIDVLTKPYTLKATLVTNWVNPTATRTYEGTFTGTVKSVKPNAAAPVVRFSGLGALKPGEVATLEIRIEGGSYDEIDLPTVTLKDTDSASLTLAPTEPIAVGQPQVYTATITSLRQEDVGRFTLFNAVRVSVTVRGAGLNALPGTNATATVEGQSFALKNTSAEDSISIGLVDGVWEEIPAPGTAFEINHETLPLILDYRESNPERGEDGGWGARNDGMIEVPGESHIPELIPFWRNRLAGDETTVPEPSFMHGKIQDMAVAQNRLTFMTADTVVASAAGLHGLFFGASAQGTIPSDPIDLDLGNDVAAEALQVVGQSLVALTPISQWRVFAADGDLGWTPGNLRVAKVGTVPLNLKVSVEVDGQNLCLPAATGPYGLLLVLAVGQEGIVPVDIGARCPDLPRPLPWMCERVNLLDGNGNTVPSPVLGRDGNPLCDANGNPVLDPGNPRTERIPRSWWGRLGTERTEGEELRKRPGYDEILFTMVRTVDSQVFSNGRQLFVCRQVRQEDGNLVPCWSTHFVPSEEEKESWVTPEIKSLCSFQNELLMLTLDDGILSLRSLYLGDQRREAPCRDVEARDPGKGPGRRYWSCLRFSPPVLWEPTSLGLAPAGRVQFDVKEFAVHCYPQPGQDFEIQARPNARPVVKKTVNNIQLGFSDEDFLRRPTPQFETYKIPVGSEARFFDVCVVSNSEFPFEILSGEWVCTISGPQDRYGTQRT